jgi:hypothetical protein
MHVLAKRCACFSRSISDCQIGEIIMSMSVPVCAGVPDAAEGDAADADEEGEKEGEEEGALPLHFGLCTYRSLPMQNSVYDSLRVGTGDVDVDVDMDDTAWSAPITMSLSA